MKAGYDDARLLVQLAEWQTACGLPEALAWLWSDSCPADYGSFIERYPAGSEGSRSAALICDYFETVGALHKHGLVNEELLFDWLSVGSVWDRIKGFVLGRRRESGGDDLWANFEALAIAHKRATRAYST